MKATFLLMIAGLLLAASSIAEEPAAKEKAARVQCVWKSLEDLAAIKPGMTRAEVEKKLAMDGGLQAASPVRFTHPDCPYFKIDVEFAVHRDPKDQNRVVFGKEDTGTKASRPYLEAPYLD